MLSNIQRVEDTNAQVRFQDKNGDTIMNDSLTPITDKSPWTNLPRITDIETPSSPIQKRVSARLHAKREAANNADTDESLNLTTNGEPSSFKEAMRAEDKHKWKDAIDDEMISLMENKTYMDFSRTSTRQTPYQKQMGIQGEKKK